MSSARYSQRGQPFSSRSRLKTDMSQKSKMSANEMTGSIFSKSKLNDNKMNSQSQKFTSLAATKQFKDT